MFLLPSSFFCFKIQIISAIPPVTEFDRIYLFCEQRLFLTLFLAFVAFESHSVLLLLQNDARWTDLNYAISISLKVFMLYNESYYYLLKYTLCQYCNSKMMWIGKSTVILSFFFFFSLSLNMFKLTSFLPSPPLHFHWQNKYYKTVKYIVNTTLWTKVVLVPLNSSIKKNNLPYPSTVDNYKEK